MPEVVVARRLKVFLEDDLDRLFPRDRWVRAVAHPTRLPAQIAPSVGDGKAKVAAADTEQRVHGGSDNHGESGEVGSDGAETMPVPGLRFSQMEPPEGDEVMYKLKQTSKKNLKLRVLILYHCSRGRSGLTCLTAPRHPKKKRFLSRIGKDGFR